MSQPERPAYAVSLGGSIMMNGYEVNTAYLLFFAAILKSRIQKVDQLTAIVTGGGAIARMYIRALEVVGETDSNVKDRIGIGITRQNARFLADFLRQVHIPTKYTVDLNAPFNRTFSVFTTGGTIPGQSTDAVAVEWARILGYRQVINITKTPFVYEYCPDGKTPDLTKPIDEMTYDDYLALVGPTHQSGENVPAGRTAIAMAKNEGIIFNIVGSDLQNIQKVFEKRPFAGTRIHP